MEQAETMSINKLIPEVFVVQGSSADSEARDGCDTEKQGGPDTGSLQESDGFIAITELTLDKLPEPIRSSDNLDTILDVAKHVVAINNNGTSSERPPDFQLGETLQGTGFIFLITQEMFMPNDEKKEHLAIVSTNKHVLYNDEEVKKATIDIFYDEPMAAAYKSGRIRRTARGKGLGTLRSNQEDDFTLAVFLFNDAVMAHIADPTFAKLKFPVLLHQLQTPTTVEGTSQESVVCVISHPLGQPKKVSFGQLLEQDVAKRSLRHNAATRVGSSGAPLLIFSPTPQVVPANSIWYHTSFDSTTQTKAGALQVNDSRLFEMKQEILNRTTVHYRPSFLAQYLGVTKLNLEETISTVSGVVKDNTLIEAVASNISYLSCLGSFILQPDAFLPSLSLDDLHACQPLEESEVRAAVEQGGEDVTKAMMFLRTAAPRFMPLVLEISLDPGLLSQFLLDQGPCYCHDIFAALESRPQGEVGEKTPVRFFHPLSRPMVSSQEPCWPFQSRTGSSCQWVSGACYAQDLLKRLLETENSITKYLSFLPPLLLLMEANKTVREIAKLSTVCLSDFTKEQESDQNRELNHKPPAIPNKVLNDKQQTVLKRRLGDRHQAVLKLLMFFVHWGLNTVNVLTHMWLLECGWLQELLPMALTASVASDNAAEGEEEILYTGQRSRNTEPATQPRFVTVEDLEAFDDMKHLLSHATTHTSQGHRDAPRLPTAEPCSCGRPLVADMIEASAHLHRVLQERKSAAERGQAEMKPEKGLHVKSSRVDGSMEETPLDRFRVPEQEKTLTSMEQEQTATRSLFAQVPDSSESSYQALKPSQRHLGGRSKPSDSNDDEQSLAKAEEKTTDGGSRTFGSSAEAPERPGEEKHDAAEKGESEYSFDTTENIMVAIRIALRKTLQHHNPDVADEQAGQPSTSGEKHDDSGDRGASVERDAQEDRASGSSYGGDDRLSRVTSSVSTSPLRSTSRQRGDASSHETNQEKLLDGHSGSESDRIRSSKFNHERNPPCENDRHLVTDIKTEADKNSNNEKDTIHNFHTLLLELLDPLLPKSATASATFMSMMRKAVPQMQTLRTSPREARQSEELAERFRVALLSTPISFRNALAAVEVLHLDCPRLLALCHRVLGCGCNGFSDLFAGYKPCDDEEEAAGDSKVPSSEDTAAAPAGKDRGEGGVWASLLLKTAVPAAGKSTAAEQSLREQGAGLSEEENDVSSSNDLATERAASSSAKDLAPGGAEDKRGKDPRQEFSTQSLKTRLRDELQRTPHKSHYRVLLEEDCLQAYSDLLVYAASEQISDENFLASFRRAQLVVLYDCRSAMQPLQGLEALAVNLMEKLAEHRTRKSRHSEQ